MKVVTICGSMRFKEDMMNEAERLSLKGLCVLTPIFSVSNRPKTKDEMKKLKEAHFKKIEMSDAIYVINKNCYIGESTLLEIRHAEKLGKNIFFYNKIEYKH